MLEQEKTLTYSGPGMATCEDMLCAVVSSSFSTCRRFQTRHSTQKFGPWFLNQMES